MNLESTGITNDLEKHVLIIQISFRTLISACKINILLRFDQQVLILKMNCNCVAACGELVNFSRANLVWKAFNSYITNCIYFNLDVLKIYNEN